MDAGEAAFVAELDRLVALGARLDPDGVFVRKRDRRGISPSYWQRTLDQVRKPIEGMIAVLTECLGIEHILARTDRGIYRRLQAKATAVSLARYFNRVLGLAPMDLARYAV